MSKIRLDPMWEDALREACHDADALHRTLRASELKPGWVVVMQDEPAEERVVHRIDLEPKWYRLRFRDGKFYLFRMDHESDAPMWERVR